jgi:uncharacterized membrane protein YraQ (UPF0718 family)
MMITTAQILTILGILSAPMISIAALVLTLAALNLSLGLRKLFVRILAFIFDYATNIKRNKEVSMNPHVSSDEPPTPVPKSKTGKVASPLVKRSSLDPIEITSKTPLISESKTNINHENENKDEITTTDHDQRISGASLQTDIQFKLGKVKLTLC